MADVELVIKIPEDTVNAIKDNAMVVGSISSDIRWDITNAMVTGTPLPKKYGRLIDADEVVKEICIEHQANSIYELSDELRSFVKKYLNEAPTILKPTKEYMIKNYAFSKSKE